MTIRRDVNTLAEQGSYWPVLLRGHGATQGKIEMQFEMKMPDLATIDSDIRMVRWLIEPGQGVKRGRSFLEVETDKASMEAESVVAGVLAETRAQADERKQPPCQSESFRNQGAQDSDRAIIQSPVVVGHHPPSRPFPWLVRMTPSTSIAVSRLSPLPALFVESNPFRAMIATPVRFPFP